MQLTKNQTNKASEVLAYVNKRNDELKECRLSMGTQYVSTEMVKFSVYILPIKTDENGISKGLSIVRMENELDANKVENELNKLELK